MFESNKGNVPSVSLEFINEGAKSIPGGFKELSAAAALNERIVPLFLTIIISAPEVERKFQMKALLLVISP